MKISKRVKRVWTHPKVKGSFIANFIVLRGKKGGRRLQLESKNGNVTFKFKGIKDARLKGWSAKAVK